MSDQTLKYFGLGIMGRADVMKALLGRVPKTHSSGNTHSHLPNYAVVVQRLKDIPDAEKTYADVSLRPRSTLWGNYGGDFVTHTLVQRRGSNAFGEIWEITPSERELILEWQMVPWGWFREVSNLAVQGSGITYCTSEMLRPGQTYHKDRTLEMPSHTQKMGQPQFLNPPLTPIEDTLNVARQVGEEFRSRT